MSWWNCSLNNLRNWDLILRYFGNIIRKPELDDLLRPLPPGIILCFCAAAVHLYSVLQDRLLVFQFSRLCAGQWCSLLSWGGGGGVRHRHRIQCRVAAHTGCVTVSLEDWDSLSPQLLSVAALNLPELYYRTTDYMKIGTGKLQRLFLIISSAFLQVSQTCSCNISFIYFNIFFASNCVTVLTATTIFSPQVEELRH